MAASTTIRFSRCGWFALLLLALLQARPALGQSEEVEALLERVTVQAITRGPDGGIYLAGFTREPDLPGAEDRFQPNLFDPSCGADPIRSSNGGCYDAFLAKLDSAGREILFATYLGGSDSDQVADLVIDAQGNIHLLGSTVSADFPLTPTAVQTDLADEGLSPAFGGDLFVAKISPTADELLYSTYLGGGGAESGGRLQFDSEGMVYVSSPARSLDFPVTEGAYLVAPPEPSFAELLLGIQAVSTFTKIDPTSSTLVYSTYFDGLVEDFEIDSRGAAVLAGPPRLLFFPTGLAPTKGEDRSLNPFIATLSPDGTTVESTIDLSGFGLGISDIELDSEGNTWITGSGASAGLPLTNQIADLIRPRDFIAKLSLDGEVLFASHLPGEGQGLVISTEDSAAVIGAAFRGSVPTTPDAHFSGPCRTGFVMHLAPSGDLLYSSYAPFLFGQVTAGFPAVNEIEFVWFTLETLNSFRSTDPPPSFACVTHGASRELIDFVEPGSFLPGTASSTPALSPGGVVDLHGFGWGPEEAIPLEFDDQGRIATTLAGIRVLFDGTPAPILSVQDRLVRAIVPFVQPPDGLMTVEIETVDGVIHSRDVHWALASPAVFTIDGTGDGQAAVLNEDGTLNSAANPARKGSVVAIFATGGGPTTSPSIDGVITPIDGALSSLVVPVAVTFGTYNSFFDPGPPPSDAQILYAGPAPGLVAGTIQVNARVPLETPSGPSIRINLRTRLYTSPFTFATLYSPTIAIE